MSRRLTCDEIVGAGLVGVHGVDPGVWCQALGDLGEVVTRPRRVDPFSGLNCLLPGRGRLFDVAVLSMRAGHQREVEHPTSGVPRVHVQRTLRETHGEVATAEGSECLPELRREIRLVEIAQPLRVGGTLAWSNKRSARSNDDAVAEAELFTAWP